MRITHSLSTFMITGAVLLAVRLGPSLVFKSSITSRQEDVSDLKGIRILAIGDSLTEGYTAEAGRGIVFHPYTEKLREILKEEVAKSTRTKAGVELEVVNRGISGETTKEIIARLGEELSQQEEPYKIIIILGGTNDIAYETPVSEIIGNLRSMLDMSVEHGATTFMMTVPECKDEDRIPLRSGIRQEINTGIFEMCGSNTIDLAKAIPYGSLSQELRMRLWSDRLHFSEAGYEFMSRLVMNAIKPTILALLPKSVIK